MLTSYRGIDVAALGWSFGDTAISDISRESRDLLCERSGSAAEIAAPVVGHISGREL
ncbi:MAG: hypothetical protein IH877_02695 [Gemmatimonadetes bacterium]|nr:hypothetical protein [Gemmatimonadota bacterium]